MGRIYAELQGAEQSSVESSSDTVMNGSSSMSGSGCISATQQTKLIGLGPWRKKRKRRKETGHGEGSSSVVLVVDGPTLMQALSLHLKDRFLQVACQCKAVMCCRATPLQKVRVQYQGSG